MRGIEPPLRAWEARVLPLNYIRQPEEFMGGCGLLPKGPNGCIGSIGHSDDRRHSPDGHQQPDDKQEGNPASSKLAFDPRWPTPFSVLPPGEEVPGE